jgi:hypothetical protein
MTILEAADEFKSHIIAIVKSGSSVLPWIDNPHDTDYIIYTESEQGEWVSAFYKLKPKNDCWFITNISNKKIRLFQYLYHYSQLVYGESIEPQPDIFEYEKEYKLILIEQLGKPLRKQKYWYHILTGIYLLENRDYYLTEEQLQNVRLCHDRQITLEIYNYIQEQLLKYKKELEE